MSEVSFDVSRREARVIASIVARAAKLVAAHGRLSHDDRLELRMDLTACHANGCPLRLDDLLAADDFNFSHDVWGIRRHIDRETGALQDLFRPRFAVKADVPA